MEYVLFHLDKLYAVSLLIGMSISVRLLLQLSGQRWITTTSHTATIVLLPIITYIITNVISGNIALSLGMVGALSIVRFRNPVRSPLELSVYFGAITMGISASVSLTWLMFLIASVLAATIVLAAINIISQHVFNRQFFNVSFSEGNSLSTLDITVSQSIELLDKSQFLKVKRFDQVSISYGLVSRKFEDLQSILSTLKDDARIESFQLHQ